MIFTYSKKGIYHEEQKLESQDTVYVKENINDRFAMMFQADGVSSCINGKKGAQIACLQAACVLSGNEEAFFRFSSRKTAYLVLEQVVCEIRREAKRYGYIPESYASTLMFCCVDRMLRRALLFNLGDGAVCSISRGRCSYLIPPDRAWGNPCLCPQTMTEGAFKDASVKTVDLEKETVIFMSTDGLLQEMRNKSYGKFVRDKIRSNDYHVLEKALGLIPNMDDISFTAYCMED